MNEQTVIPEQQIRKAPWYRGRCAIWGVTSGVVVTTLVALGATAFLLGIGNLDQRLSSLESQDNTVATAEALFTLQTAIKSLQVGMTDNQQRVTALQKQVDSQNGHAGEMEALRQTVVSLQQTLQTQESHLGALNDQLNVLSVKATAAAASAEKIPEVAKKPLPVKSRPAAGVARQAPFVLTGVEKRGAESWAAVAPRGYSSLSQIALIGEGETVSGWMLIHAGYGKATFRVNGRLTALRVE